MLDANTIDNIALNLEICEKSLNFECSSLPTFFATKRESGIAFLRGVPMITAEFAAAWTAEIETL